MDTRVPNGVGPKDRDNRSPNETSDRSTTKHTPSEHASRPRRTSHIVGNRPEEPTTIIVPSRQPTFPGESKGFNPNHGRYIPPHLRPDYTGICTSTPPNASLSLASLHRTHRPYMSSYTPAYPFPTLRSAPICMRTPDHYTHAPTGHPNPNPYPWTPHPTGPMPQPYPPPWASWPWNPHSPMGTSYYPPKPYPWTPAPGGPMPDPYPPPYASWTHGSEGHMHEHEHGVVGLGMMDDVSTDPASEDVEAWEGDDGARGRRPEQSECH